MRTAILLVVLVAAPAAADEKLDGLVKNLKNPGDAERIKAVEALAKMGADAKPAAADLCEVACRDFKDEIRKLAGEALIKVRPDLGPHVKVINTETDAAPLVKAATAIGKLGPTDGLAGTWALRFGIYRYDRGKYTDPAIVVACLDALGAIRPPDKDVPHEIGQAATLNPKDEIRLAAIKALGEIGAARTEQRKSCVPYLKIVIGTAPSNKLRVEAIRAVGRQGSAAKGLLRGLQKYATDDPDPDVRKAAAEAADAIQKADS